MKSIVRLLVTGLVIAATSSAKAQTYTTANAHSHNDYMQAVPFLHAYSAGFGAIEADIFNVNGTLLVSHSDKDLKPENTFKKMYIDPIVKSLAAEPARKLTLLIDLKQNYSLIMPVLIKELEPVRKICTTDKKQGQLFILISGSRPAPELFKNYPDFIYFDEDLQHIYNKEELKKIGQVSLRYTIYSKWKGEGPIPTAEEARVTHVIDSVHSLGKRIRFWEAPDNPTGWAQLIKMKADVIGTDNIDELSSYLKAK